MFPQKMFLALVVALALCQVTSGLSCYFCGMADLAAEGANRTTTPSPNATNVTTPTPKPADESGSILLAINATLGQQTCKENLTDCDAGDGDQWWTCPGTDVVCVKILRGSGIVVKGCVAKPASTKMECIKGQSATTKETCYCKGDLCNGGMGPYKTPFGLMALSLVVILGAYSAY